MKRRSFITGLGATLAFSSACKLASFEKRAAAAGQQMIFPRALKPGDTVGYITPATFVSDPDLLNRATRNLMDLGLNPKFGKSVGKRSGYLGGSIDERLDDLHQMFRDPEIRGIFAVRGGYGSGQLLDGIDYDLIRKNPKVFVGYSDITALHLAINRHAGLVTFHGPVGISSFPDYTKGYFQKAVFESKPIGPVANRTSHPVHTIRSGKASGRLIGGNLSLICELMGTPYEIDTRGKILFLEDTSEEPYRIDRMLTQLRLAGKFKDAAGIVFGECSGCKPNECAPAFGASFTVKEVAEQLFGNLAVPVVSGLTIGHTEDQITLPQGVMATLDGNNGQLIIDEAAVSP